MSTSTTRGRQLLLMIHGSYNVYSDEWPKVRERLIKAREVYVGVNDEDAADIQTLINNMDKEFGYADPVG